jgi:hypothetical protein
MERLRTVATEQSLALDDLVEKLAAGLGSQGQQDDTAILAIRWRA